MMNGFHNGWGMGGYGWIIGFIILIVIIWVIVKALSQNHKPK
jgi:hypothetical protein